MMEEESFTPRPRTAECRWERSPAEELKQLVAAKLQVRRGVR